MDIEEIARNVIDCGYKIHTQIGPGLLESVYETVMLRMLERRGFRVERQKALSFEFDGIKFEDAFRVGLLVENQLIIELKSADKDAPLYAKQLLTYLKLSNMPLSILINFGLATFKQGVHRMANKHTDPVYFDKPLRPEPELP